MSEKPLVTILIPTRNRVAFLKTALVSVLNQTYTNLEVIVQDNNSQDGTREYVTELSKQDNRIKYFSSNKDLSMLENWNSGTKWITGKYFVRLDDDNLFKKEFIEEAIIAMDRYKLDYIGYLPAIIYCQRQKLQLLFKPEDEIELLTPHQIIALEYFTLTDSNFTLYKVDSIKKVMHQELIMGQGFYHTSLPDRYLNYRFALSSQSYKAGMCTKIMGMVRVEHIHAYKSQSITQHINFENLDLSKVDCHEIFGLHIVNTLKTAFANTSSPYEAWFYKNICSPAMQTNFLKRWYLRSYKANNMKMPVTMILRLEFETLLSMISHPFDMMQGEIVWKRYISLFFKRIKPEGKNFMPINAESLLNDFIYSNSNLDYTQVPSRHYELKKFIKRFV